MNENVYVPMHERACVNRDCRLDYAIPKEGALQTGTIKHKICITKHG